MAKLFHIGKDGGPKSTVTGYWLIELKRLVSVALLKFGKGSRDEYHTHAFNCISWLLKGELREECLDGTHNVYKPSLRPILTFRDTFHRVVSVGDSWVLTFRGPWQNEWYEFDPKKLKLTTLTHGREVVQTS